MTGSSPRQSDWGVAALYLRRWCAANSTFPQYRL